ncbi:MAG: TonB-dependent receptor [Acidobacteriia bacterium]|nr:TonB-dependent receptor [Terriglobia bacterium]
MATPVSIFAQGTDLGVIRGVVTDASNAVVPNARISLTDVATNTPRPLTADASGEYEIQNVKPGAYKLTVTATGFNTLEITGITVLAGNTIRADARLEVAKSAESVVVQAEASAVQTDSPTVSGTLQNRDLIELPRDSRDIYEFLYLNPNITQSAGGDGNFKFLGAQSYGASFSLDGQRSNGGVFGQPTNSQPSLETVGEITVLTNNFTAEYAGISNIRIVTKRGEDHYHGSLFYNNRNSALAAWSLTDKNALGQFVPSPSQPNYPNPYSNLNELGASLGGKVPKLSRTYFMTAYERRYTAQPLNLRSTTLAHPSLWTGDFTKVNDSVKPLVPAGVTLTAGEIATDTLGGLGQRLTQIPQRLLNPITQSIIQNYFPPASVNAAINPANGRLTGYYNLVPQHGARDLGTARIDHDFSESDRFYTSFNTQSVHSDGSAVASVFTGLGLIQRDIQDYTVANSYTRIISPRVVNEARGGINFENNFAHGNIILSQFMQSVGFNPDEIKAYGAVVGPPELNTFGHIAISLGNFQGIGNGGRSIYRPLDQHLVTFGDTLTWQKGKHSLKFGGDVVRNSALDGFTANRGNPRGILTYTGTGIDAMTRFLLGIAPNTVSYVTALRPPMDVYNWEHGYFVQDEFRIESKLTLSLGVRYELVTPFIENNNLIVNFDPNYKGPNGQLGRFIVPTQSVFGSVDQRMVAYGIASADQAGVGRGLVHMDTNNIAPRAGFAWRLTDKSVLRGGTGVFYPTSAAQGIRDAMASAPFNQGVTFTNTAANPIQPWPSAGQRGVVPIAGGQPRVAGSQPSVNIIPFDLQQPRIEQYNVTYEREIPGRTTLRFSYLGTYMHGLIAGVDRNMQPPSDKPFGTFNDAGTPCSPDDGDCTLSDADLARRPFPALSDYMAQYGNFGHGRSNAMQIEATRRYSNGFSFEAAYTLLDQKTTALDVGNSSLGGPGYNQFQPELDFSRDSFVSRQRLSFYGIFDTPIGAGRKYGSGMPKALDAVIGGWQLSWNGFVKSGTGFTPYWTCDNCDPVWPGNVGSSFLDAVGDFNNTSFRPTVLGDPAKRSGDRFWDPSVFGPPSVGADLFSNPKAATRNSLLGPGTWGVNLGVQKRFRFGEHVRAALGADIDNIFNHPLVSSTDTSFANLGSFSLDVDPNTGRLLPITRISPNPDFGRLINSFTQDGIDARRAIRLRLRITF